MLCSRTNTIQRRVIWSYSVIQKKRKRPIILIRSRWKEEEEVEDEEAGFMLYAVLKQAYRPESWFTWNWFTWNPLFTTQHRHTISENEFQDHLGIPMASSVIFHKHMTHVPKEDFVRISLPQRVRGQLKELSWWFPSNLKPALFLV